MSRVSKTKKVSQSEEKIMKFNAISKKTNFMFNLLFIILAALCIVPFVFVLIISFTSEQSLQLNGYQFWPSEWSLDAYKYIFASGSNILNAYGITILLQ
ncbi:Putative ABC transporter [Candidatus Arthromitus sp. SFB-2]|nr:Putative ABC transporter [Candidatus Arthromitus sp. SFB-2]